MRRRLSVSGLALCVVLCAAGGAAYAAFTATTSNPSSSLAAKRIYPAERSTSAWSVEDAADGSAADASSTMAFADGSFYKTKNWASSWSTSRYVDFALNGPLPTGLAKIGRAHV